MAPEGVTWLTPVRESGRQPTLPPPGSSISAACQTLRAQAYSPCGSPTPAVSRPTPCNTSWTATIVSGGRSLWLRMPGTCSLGRLLRGHVHVNIRFHAFGHGPQTANLNLFGVAIAPVVVQLQVTGIATSIASMPSRRWNEYLLHLRGDHSRGFRNFHDLGDDGLLSAHTMASSGESGQRCHLVYGLRRRVCSIDRKAGELQCDQGDDHCRWRRFACGTGNIAAAGFCTFAVTFRALGLGRSYWSWNAHSLGGSESRRSRRQQHPRCDRPGSAACQAPAQRESRRRDHFRRHDIALLFTSASSSKVRRRR